MSSFNVTVSKSTTETGSAIPTVSMTVSVTSDDVSDCSIFLFRRVVYQETTIDNFMTVCMFNDMTAYPTASTPPAVTGYFRDSTVTLDFQPKNGKTGIELRDAAEEAIMTRIRMLAASLSGGAAVVTSETTTVIEF